MMYIVKKWRVKKSVTLGSGETEMANAQWSTEKNIIDPIFF